MNCYRCKTKIERGMREMMPAKNRREKDGFRNICYECYPIIMAEKGYIKINGMWRRTTPFVKADTK